MLDDRPVQDTPRRLLNKQPSLPKQLEQLHGVKNRKAQVAFFCNPGQTSSQNDLTQNQMM